MPNFPTTLTDDILYRDLGSDGLPVASPPTAHDKLDTVKADTNNILADTADMQPKLGTPSTGTLAGDISAVKTVVDAIEVDTQDIQSSLANATYGLSALATEIDALQSDINGIETLIGTPVTSLAADIAAVKTVVDEIEIDTTAIEADTQDIQSTLADATYGLAALDTEIDAIQTDVTAIDTKLGTPVTSVSADIAAIKTVVDAIEVDTQDIQTTLGAPTHGSVSADLAAIESIASSIQNNTKTTVSLPQYFEIPASGSTVLRFVVNNYNSAGNGMEAFDAAPTVAVVNEAGTSRSGNLVNDSGTPTTTMIVDATGRYHLNYKVTSTDAVEGLIFTITGVENSETRYFDRVVRVVDDITSTFTASDRADLQAVLADTADMQPKLGTPVTSISADIAAVKTVVDAIEVDTQAIEADTQDIQSSLANATYGLAALDTEIDAIQSDINGIETVLGTPVTSVSADLAAIKTVVDAIEVDTTAIEADTQDLQNSVKLIESKDTNLTYDRATDSLEAISEKIDGISASASKLQIFRAVKLSGVIAPGNSELVDLGPTEGVVSTACNIKEIRAIPQTQTSTNFKVEIYEDSAATIALWEYDGAKASKGDLRRAADLLFTNQNSTPNNHIYVKITNVTDSSSSRFNVEIRGVVGQIA